ncbi:MAG: J domain-containing protein [Desulfobacterales bacterium]
MAKSYHAVLGVSPDASKREVKNAYRRLAKQYHPDHEGGDTRKFRDIQEAYNVLADSEKRRRYEQSASQEQVRVRVSRPRSSQGGPEPLIPEREPFAAPGRKRPARAKIFSENQGEDLFDWILRNFF